MTEPKSTETSQPQQVPTNPYANGNNPFIEQQSASASQGASQQLDPTSQKTIRQPAQTPQDAPQQPLVTPQQPLRLETPEEQPETVQVSNISKALWFAGGVLLGLIGLLIFYFVNIRKPRYFRMQILKYAAIGMIVGFIINIIVLNMTGITTGSSLMWPMTGGSSGTPAGTGSGIF